LSLRRALAVARRSRSKLEHEIPRFTRNKLRNLRGGREIATPSARNDRGELLNNLVNLRGGLCLLFREMGSRGGEFTASGGYALKVVKN